MIPRDGDVMAAKGVGIFEDLVLGEICAGGGMDFNVRTAGACDDLSRRGCEREDIRAVCYVSSVAHFRLLLM